MKDGIKRMILSIIKLINYKDTKTQGNTKKRMIKT